MIYVIGNREEKVCKIGYSYNPKARLNQLKTAIPYEIELLFSHYGTVDLEKHLHDKYKSIHIRGEWFKYNDNVLEDIKKEVEKVKAGKVKGLDKSNAEPTNKDYTISVRISQELNYKLESICGSSGKSEYIRNLIIESLTIKKEAKSSIKQSKREPKTKKDSYIDQRIKQLEQEMKNTKSK